MRRSWCHFAVAVLPLAIAPAHAERPGDKIAGSYICVFKDNMVSRGSAKAEANRAAQSVQAQLKHVYSASIRGFAVNMPEQALERMKGLNTSIAYCEQDQVVTIGQNTIFARGKPGGGTVQPAQETPWGIARVGGGVCGAQGTAWIIDTGIDFSHPDLNVDQSRSRSFLSNVTSPVDQNGHGTHVSGTIAALDNTIGVIGVAPGAKVVAVRVLDRRGRVRTRA